MDKLMSTKSKSFWVAVGFALCLGLLLILSIINFVFAIKNLSLKDVKELGESIKPIIEISAIVIAGLWSYRLFIKNRVEYPYAELTHNISHWKLANGKILLSVFITMKNSGKMLLELSSGMIFVQQIRPLLKDLKKLIDSSDDQELREGKTPELFHDRGAKIAWRELGYRNPMWKKGEINIEPGESEEFQYDFILPESIQTVKVITYFTNIKIKKREIGWRLTSIYDMKGDTHGRRKAN